MAAAENKLVEHALRGLSEADEYPQRTIADDDSGAPSEGGDSRGATEKPPAQ
jgi:hypothetical protein